MLAHQAAELVRAFASAGMRAWVGGGWGVDALVGRMTREHGDLDLAVDSRDLSELVAMLATRGFELTVDWSPSRLEVAAADGRRVDLHPVRFAPDGNGWQAGVTGGAGFHYSADGFTTGSIDGVIVPCLTARQQLAFRSGYELRDVDLHDIPLLHEAIRD